MLLSYSVWFSSQWHAFESDIRTLLDAIVRLQEKSWNYSIYNKKRIKEFTKETPEAIESQTSERFTIGKSYHRHKIVCMKGMESDILVNDLKRSQIHRVPLETWI